jgi:hypothetical protein
LELNSADIIANIGFSADLPFFLCDLAPGINFGCVPNQPKIEVSSSSHAITARRLIARIILFLSHSEGALPYL